MRRLVIYVGVVTFAAVIGLGHLKHGSIDAIQRLALTRSLLENRTILTQEFGAIKYAPLQSILMIPPYWLGLKAAGLTERLERDPNQVAYRLCALLFTPSVVAATCALFFWLAWNMAANVKLALVSTYLLLFGTLLLPYSRIMFSEPVNALLLLLSFALTVRSSQGHSTTAVAFLGVSLGLLVLNNILFAPLLPVVFVALGRSYVRRGQQRRLLPLTVAGVVSGSVTAVLWGIYNTSRFGSLFRFGYADENFSLSLIPTGVYAQLFSIGRGLLFYSTTTILCSVFFVVSYPTPPLRKWSVFLWSSLALMVAYLMLYGAWHSYEGGWCWGPRFMLPFIPVIHLVLPFMLQALSSASRAARMCCLAIIASGIMVNAYEFLGVYEQYERATFGSGSLPYAYSVFFPVYSPLLNNWSLAAALHRLPQFIAVAVLSYFLLCIVPLRWWKTTTVLSEACVSSNLS